MRLVALAVVFFGLFAVARAVGAQHLLSREAVRSLAERTGPRGVALFVLAFALGSLAHVPPITFLAASVLAWGPLRGALYSYLGGLGSIALVYLVARAIAGPPPVAPPAPAPEGPGGPTGEATNDSTRDVALEPATGPPPERPTGPASPRPRAEGLLAPLARYRLLARALGEVRSRPLRAVFVVRALGFVNPPVTWLLAASGVRLGPYLLGSALGLLPSLAFLALVLGHLLR